MALLVDQEQGDEHDGAGEFPERPGCAPADGGGVHQDVDQQKHAAGDEAGADRVELPQRGGLGPFAVDEPKRRQEDGGDDRQVDEEHPPPAHLGGEHAAEERSGRARHAGHAAPGADRFDPVAAGVEGRRQNGQRCGRHHRRADPLDQPAPDQHPFGSCQAAHERRDPEQRRPGHEQAPPAEQVGQAAAEQQEPAVGEQVGARDPLQVLDRGVQVRLDLRQRDIHDGRVEKVHERDRAQQGEGELAAPRPEEGRWSRCCRSSPHRTGPLS